MSFARKIRRNIDRAKNGRRTCPKCHTELTEKSGYGLVCENCGWWKLKRIQYEKEKGGAE